MRNIKHIAPGAILLILALTVFYNVVGAKPTTQKGCESDVTFLLGSEK